jgi:hypothetical protein
MTLRTPSGLAYEPTQEDVLWLLRAVAVEGPPERIVAQTLVNGFMWARERAGWENRTLAEWVQAYAQPVNPRWLVGGDLFEASLKKAESDKERAEKIARAKNRVTHRARTLFSEDDSRAVQEALSRPPVFRAATDYAAPSVVREPPWEPLTAAVPGKNRLWTRPAAKGWTGYTVSGAVGVLPLIALVTIAIVLLSRS